MSQQNTNDGAFFLGCPVEFQNLCLVYPPKVRDVLSTKVYSVFLQILTISQEEIEDGYAEEGIEVEHLQTPLEYLLANSYHNKEFSLNAQAAFEFFIHEPVYFLYSEKKIILGELDKIDNIDKLRIIDENNYFDFQQLVREACGIKPVEPPNPDEHPKIKRMKALARKRDRVKAKSQKGLTPTTLVIAICCMGFGITPLNVGELSYCAVGELLSMYQNKEKYDLDIKSLLAGADSKKVKPQYWIKNKED